MSHIMITSPDVRSFEMFQRALRQIHYKLHCNCIFYSAPYNWLYIATNAINIYIAVATCNGIFVLA